uniref:Phosphatidic acid phosphatase type 2/haloperoxidase domain-containing protein n=1 Tax=Haptolina ericina TaxID=156174 RepID=A0A7S3AWV8_9EUKA
MVNGVCTGAAAAITEGRKSFPSGHTALSYAGLGFLALFLAARVYRVHLSWLPGEMWKIPLVAAPWFGALLVGLSRIEDYWHHWEDVLVGGLIGNICCYTMYRLRYPALTEDAPSVPHVLRVSRKDRQSPPTSVTAAEAEVVEFRV